MSATDALQRTLAAEHAAIFVFGALGGRASALTAPALRRVIGTAYDVHVTRRDRLRALVRAAGGDPVAAEPAYRLPSPLLTALQIEAEALRVERACATTYAALVAETTGGDRRWAVEALIAVALAERSFGGLPEPLPGLGRR
ncbi:MAG TPA: ferritin-like domain-containing protein [Nocardioides sp.]|nr:ferritin-like domain-containing protein [Nocardioides sp.]